MFKTIGSYLVQLYAGGMDGSTHNLGHLTSRHCCCALQAPGAAGATHNSVGRPHAEPTRLLLLVPVNACL
jgi:hypothetical protein